MFTQAWFWISVSAFFFNSNFYYYRSKGALSGAKVMAQEALASISVLGLIVFWIIGLFVADGWWQPLAAFGISVVSSGIIGAITDRLLGKAAVLIGAISPFLSSGLTIASYLTWY